LSRHAATRQPNRFSRACLSRFRVSLAADKAIKREPKASVLKISVGRKIKLTEAAFVRLYTASFAEIESNVL
jgi:hypothetical protein